MKETKVCEQCGKEFIPYAKNSRFCSHKCSDLWWQEQRKEQRRAQQKETRICERCGKEFIPRNGKQIYCCRACGRAVSGYGLAKLQKATKWERLSNVPKAKPTEQKVDTSMCRTCRYYVALTGGSETKTYVRFCSYILETGKMRGCSPTGCTKWERRKGTC